MSLGLPYGDRVTLNPLNAKDLFRIAMPGTTFVVPIGDVIYASITRAEAIRICERAERYHRSLTIITRFRAAGEPDDVWIMTAPFGASL